MLNSLNNTIVCVWGGGYSNTGLCFSGGKSKPGQIFLGEGGRG